MGGLSLDGEIGHDLADRKRVRIEDIVVCTADGADSLNNGTLDREELERAGIPRTTNPQGLGIVAPSILDYGSPEQIERYAMPLLRGEVAACLGMSEPDAGSDPFINDNCRRFGQRPGPGIILCVCAAGHSF